MIIDRTGGRRISVPKIMMAAKAARDSTRDIL